jgi:hypothetical protein
MFSAVELRSPNMMTRRKPDLWAEAILENAD